MAAFVPTLVVQRWMQGVLTGTPAVTAVVGRNIYPNLSATDIKVIHITHTFGGPNNANVTRPMGGPIPLVNMFWDITGWNPGYGQQPLEPAMLAIMEALIGQDTTGTQRRFTDGGRTFTIDCDYVGPEIVPIEVAPSGVWAPIRERYSVTLRPS